MAAGVSTQLSKQNNATEETKSENLVAGGRRRQPGSEVKKRFLDSEKEVREYEENMIEDGIDLRKISVDQIRRTKQRPGHIHGEVVEDAVAVEEMVRKK